MLLFLNSSLYSKTIFSSSFGILFSDKDIKLLLLYISSSILNIVFTSLLTEVPYWPGFYTSLIYIPPLETSKFIVKYGNLTQRGDYWRKHFSSYISKIFV